MKRDVSGLSSPLLSAPAVAAVLIGFCVPMAVLLVYSFWPTRNAEIVVGTWTLENYGTVFGDPTYWRTLISSFVFVTFAALLSLVVALPFSYFVALRARPERRAYWVLAAVLPFSASYLIRIYAWLGLFGDRGLINDTLLRLHVIRDPLGVFSYGQPAIVITFVYLLLPLAFLTTYVAIERMDPALLEAASDLGALPWETLARVTLPIARTGLLAAFAFCFLTVIGDYVTPTLIGGSQGALYSALLVTKFDFSQQWGLGSALAFTLLAGVLLFVAALRLAVGGVPSAGEFTRRYAHRRSPVLTAYAVAILAVAYLPMALVVLFAFNRSEFVGLPISGLTLDWFATAFDDSALIDALQTSLVVVAWALAISLTLGTLAAVQLARARGRWRQFSLGVLAIPLGLPSIMVGLSIIIALHAVGVPRGLWTIIAAHALLILPVVTFIVLVRLEGLDPNMELAAMDLGANRWQTFLRVTAPQAMAGVIASALLGFTMSMDEFIVTFLVTGHDATLPLFIYGAVHYAVTPEINALSTLMLASSFVLCGVAGLLLRSWGRGRPGGLSAATDAVGAPGVVGT